MGDERQMRRSDLFKWTRGFYGLSFFFVDSEGVAIFEVKDNKY